MASLAAALAWAARGFRIFPLQENSKDPIDIGWTSLASTDPTIIKSWWTDPLLGGERDYNIGFLTTGWIVPDIDTKKGKVGLKTMAEIGLEFDTLTVATPSGGYHLIYRNDGPPVGQSPLGKDIDVRSHNGYVVAPGSTLDGVAYRVVIDEPVAPFPVALRHLLSAPRQRPERPAEISFDLDQPEFIEMAAHWLRTAAPKAIETQHGDDTTYRVACRVRDFGLSEEANLSLLAEVWNPTCEPPWESDELKTKVENAYRYATGAAGGATAQAAFADVQPLEPPDISYRHGPNGTPYHFGNMLAVGEIVTRPWVFGTLLLNKTVTAIVAPSGAGKSMLKLIIAAHLAVAKDFMDHKCFRSGKSIIFDAEDDVEEMSRRLNAICTAYGFDLKTVRERVCLISEDEIMLQLTEPGPIPRINNAQITKLIETLRDPEVVMLALGPLADLHALNENDNITMRYVMGVLRLVGREGDVAVLVDHHTAKPPMASSEAWVGSQYAGRGATAIPAKARCVATLFSASETDCLDLGVPVAQRGDFVRLDTGKQSYAKAKDVRWLRWQGVQLWNGDEVGVLVPHEAQDSRSAAGRYMADMLIEEMRATGTATLNFQRTLDVLMRDPLLAKEGKKVLRNRLERVLTAPIRKDGMELAIMRGANGAEGVLLR